MCSIIWKKTYPSALVRSGSDRCVRTARCASQASRLLAAAVMVLVSSLDASAADICFQPTALVSGSTVRLRDIAVVSASEAATMTLLENVALAPAPAPGRRMRLEFAEIRSRLEATGVPAVELNYSGSTVVVVASADALPPVKAKTKKIAKTRVAASSAQVKRAEQVMADAVRRSLKDKHRESPTMFIDVIVDPADAHAVLANSTQSFEIGAVNAKSTEPQAIPVGYQDAQGQSARFQVQCIVSERPQIPVLLHSVSSGDVIHESDLEWRPVDSTTGVLTRLDAIVDKEAKKTLHPDSPIHPDDIRNVPLVRANDIVTGIWKSGSIRISGQFKAKGDGGLGDVITLVKLTGRDQLAARVTDVHEAEILSADGAKSAAREDDGGNPGDGASTRRSIADKLPQVQTVKPPLPTASSVSPVNSIEER